MRLLKNCLEDFGLVNEQSYRKINIFSVKLCLYKTVNRISSLNEKFNPCVDNKTASGNILISSNGRKRERGKILVYLNSEVRQSKIITLSAQG